MSRGTPLPFSPGNNNSPRLLGVAERAPHLSQFFEPAPLTPDPTGGQPTPLSTSGGFPPQKAHTYVHAEVSTGTLSLYGTPPPKPSLVL